MEPGFNLLVPVFLSIGVVFYFSMSHEPQWTVLLGLTGAFAFCLGSCADITKFTCVAWLFCLCVSVSPSQISDIASVDALELIGSDITVRLTRVWK